MRIINELNIEIYQPDLKLGKLVKDRLFVAHHDATEYVPEKWHYELLREYPNGGRDYRKVVDAPGVMAKDAWDEYEEVYRYVLYTDKELAEISELQSENLQDRIARLEEQIASLLLILNK